MSESNSLHYRADNYRRSHVATSEALQVALEQLSEASALGVDLEMGQRVQRYPGGQQEWKHVLALIQIASDSASVVIDPLRCSDLSPLAPLMAGPIRKVFLGGGQDVALLQAAGIPPRNIVDVGEIALGIFGRREDGMAALAERIFGLHLDKTIRRTDWLVRPLDLTLLSYAHRDAELTLLIYRWFQRFHSEATILHERTDLDPALPPSTPEWIRVATAKSSVDAHAVAMAFGYDARKQGEVLAGEVGSVLRACSAPRQVNRLVRLAADLGLSALVPEIVPLTASPSSLLRSSAARALGTLATLEEAQDVLAELANDGVEEVRKVAGGALRELSTRPPPIDEPQEVEEEEPSLNEDAMAKLRALLADLEP